MLGTSTVQDGFDRLTNLRFRDGLVARTADRSLKGHIRGAKWTRSDTMLNSLLPVVFVDLR